MKRILPFLLFTSILFVTQGQKISVTPIIEKTAVVDLSDFMTTVELVGKITNISTKTLLIKWTQSLWDQPFEWRTELSDRDNYYFTDEYGYTDSEYVMPLAIKPGESVDLNIHVYPNGRAGTATYIFDIIDVAQPSKIMETMTYYVNIQQSKNETTNDIKKVKIFPNPATHYFEITPNTVVSKIKVYNIFSQLRSTFYAEEGMKYDISAIPDGRYFIEFLDKDGRLLRTLLLFKQTPKA